MLEEALAWADGALLGAETLRRHGSTCLIHADDLRAQRRQQGLPEQPVALVASRGGDIPATLPFFAQPLERWLLLAEPAARLSGGDGPADASGMVRARPSGSAAAEREAGLIRGADRDDPISGGWGRPRFGMTPDPALPAGFARVLPLTGWEQALRRLAAAGLERLVVLGGAALAASLLAENRLDELQLTLCPRLLGGEHSWLGPDTVLPLAAGGGWRLLELRRLEGEELLLRYDRESPQD